MESFFAGIQQQWPARRADYHWHVLPDPEPVRAQLTLPYRELAHRAGLAPVPAIWTHVWRNGVVCPVSPEQPLHQLWRITTATSRQVTDGRFGAGADLAHPHLALAYAVGHVDDAPLQAWLADHDVPEARLRVSQVSLVAQRHDGLLSDSNTASILSEFRSARGGERLAAVETILW